MTQQPGSPLNTVGQSGAFNTAEDGPDTREDQYIIFRLGDTEYGAHINFLQEVNPLGEVTPVPNVPNWVEGIINLRGTIISVVSLRRFFGLPSIARERSTRLIVARHDDMVIGFVVDRVRRIMALPPTNVTQPTANMENRLTPYITGIYYGEGGQLIVLLDFERLLTSPELLQFEPV